LDLQETYVPRFEQIKFSLGFFSIIQHIQDKWEIFQSRPIYKDFKIFIDLRNVQVLLFTDQCGRLNNLLAKAGFWWGGIFVRKNQVNMVGLAYTFSRNMETD